MKSLIVLADGTGNSAAKLFKTNVWRLYQALDLADRPARDLFPGEVDQIAYYHDGVGTSSFRPLALLGGAFGWGLKRNLLDLYMFLCRNYEDGDQIHAFGFSRGAFTVRLLIGMVADQGLVRSTSDRDLERYARDAYRAYRRRFPGRVHGLGPRWQKLVVTALRNGRDLAIRAYRRLRGRGVYRKQRNWPIDTIAFVGVFDTVAAYGMPVAELTRGIDRWVWPLSMPNYALSAKVACARHALSLDDERDAFHPLLWDERAERDMIAGGTVSPDRLRQVWFPGVHSDVGGGYPDDAVSTIPLEWMIGHAVKAGLRFRRDPLKALMLTRSASGPLHDSRRGLAGYYRYQPRRLSAKLDPPTPSTLIMRDPDLEGHGLLTSLRVHESAIERLSFGTEHYAPIALPDRFEIVGADGGVRPFAPPSAAPPPNRPTGTDLVWNDVWRKRVTYFATVGVSVLLALMPLLPDSDACAGPQCLLSPVIMFAGSFIPAFAEPWIDSFARHPGLFLTGLLALIALMRRGTTLQRHIHDRMRTIWHPANPPVSDLPAPDPGCWSDPFIYRLRHNTAYLRALQHLKWRLIPGVFGAGLLGFGVLAALLFGFTLAVRVGDLSTDRFGPACASANAPTPGVAPDAILLSASAICTPTPWTVTEGKRYRVSFTVVQPWTDGPPDMGWFKPDGIAADPTGFESDSMPFYARFGSLILRVPDGRWLQPLTMIGTDRGANGMQLLRVRRARSDGSRYFAEFTASRTGPLSLSVNDVMIPWAPPNRQPFYKSNAGTATVRLQQLDAR
jgi:uncharacterized protein (DUF2235 family)